MARATPPPHILPQVVRHVPLHRRSEVGGGSSSPVGAQATPRSRLKQLLQMSSCTHGVGRRRRSGDARPSH
eukprot:11832834-Alexandrium_andersonii.AAC.1